jgi:hypothetical protein
MPPGVGSSSPKQQRAKVPGTPSRRTACSTQPSRTLRYPTNSPRRFDERRSCVVAVDFGARGREGVDGINKVSTANAGMAIATRGMANKPNRQRHDVYFNDVLCGQVSKSGPMTHCCKGSGPGRWP